MGWGGSYGGYLTLRAMSVDPERFGAGVAQYGFVHNRWMTYEGGDFTWEDEYLIPPPEMGEGEIPVDGSLSKDTVGIYNPDQPRERSGTSVKRSASDVWPLPRELEASDV